MKPLLIVIGATATLLGAGRAYSDGYSDNAAQTPLDPLDPTIAVSPITIVQGDGVKVGEGTSFYPQVGVETGYESNTFYTANNPIGAGIVTVLIEAGFGSLSPQRLAPTQTDDDDRNARSAEATADATASSWKYDANAYASYSQYISSNSDAQAQGGLGLGFRGDFLTPHQGTFSVYGNDGYDRILRAEDYESRTNDPRDLNTLLLRLDIHPQSAFSGYVGYANTLDTFEDDPQYPDRLMNTLLGRLSYNFFPASAVFLNVTQGYESGIGGANKVTSYPFSAQLGVSTALTVHTSLFAQGGYQQGFYVSGPDYQAFTGSLYFEYRYAHLSALRLEYSYNHQDSINAQFYGENVFQGWLEHKVGGVFGVYLTPEIRFREYEGLDPPLMGPPNRDDVIAAAALGIRYQFRTWIAASVQYQVIDDSTNYRYTGGTTMLDPSYLLQEVFGAVRLAY